MSHAIKGLIYCWKKNLDYAAKLVADLEDSQMAIQPVSNLSIPANHPAWVLSHLNVYLPIIEALVRGEAFDDPKGHRFGMQSKPESDRSVYPSKANLLDEFIGGHERVIALLENADDAVLGQQVSLERWQPIMPVAGIALPYLMLNHENGHLGQVSAWRRIQGLSSV